LPGKAGLCGVRRGPAETVFPAEDSRTPVQGPAAGGPELPYYGLVTALAHDPVEKKPLYHWRPGSLIASAGFAGCNLHCPFCQNWHISQLGHEAPDARGGAGAGRRTAPEELVAAAEAGASSAIAYTYSEPLVHAEFLVEAMEIARSRGMANVLVTNGCANAEPAREILKLTDAANIDLKCFSKKTYGEVLGGDLRRVLDFISTALELGVHTEITTLIVPGLNDRQEELDALADFIADLAGVPDRVVPWHLSAYHPDWKWNAPPTGSAALAGIARRARERRKELRYVYIGNAAAPPEFRDTVCPACGAVLVKRGGYRIDTRGLMGTRPYYCAACKNPAPFRYE
jgi:pyruvate formate lyase activating enzyme